MSRDLRDLLQRSAPQPQASLDVAGIARRGQEMRRHGLILRLGASVSLLLLGVALGPGVVRSLERSLSAGRGDDPVYISPPGEVLVPKTPKVAGVFRRSGRGVPQGPQYVVASGRFEEGQWGEYEGKMWRYLAWGHETNYCSSFVVGELTADDGAFGCTAGGDPRDHIVSHAYDPGDQDLLSIAYGEVSKQVATVEFRLTNGQAVRVVPIVAPQPLNVPVNYYVTFLPTTDNGRIIAFDADGDVLEQRQLCHGGCLDGPGRRARGSRSPPATGDRAPMSYADAAAAFALQALGTDGLINALGEPSYDYKGIAVDGRRAVASFVRPDCSRPKRGICRPGPVTRAQVTVVRNPKGAFVVVGAEGFAPAERERLVGYGARPPGGPPRSVYSEFRVVDGIAYGWTYWIGEIPSRNNYECHFVFLDGKGEVVGKTDAAQHGPVEEATRYGQIAMGVPPETVDVRVTCLRD